MVFAEISDTETPSEETGEIFEDQRLKFCEKKLNAGQK